MKAMQWLRAHAATLGIDPPTRGDVARTVVAAS
jgi:hypothetical protein